MESEALMTVQEAAAWIGVTESVIRHATHGGRLPFVRRYGRTLIESSQLQAYRARIQSGAGKALGAGPLQEIPAEKAE